MKTERNNGQEPESPVADTAVPAKKKAYLAPQLIEYGSIAKLTATGGASGADGMAMMACL